MFAQFGSCKASHYQLSQLNVCSTALQTFKVRFVQWAFACPVWGCLGSLVLRRPFGFPFLGGIIHILALNHWSFGSEDLTAFNLELDSLVIELIYHICEPLNHVKIPSWKMLVKYNGTTRLFFLISAFTVHWPTFSQWAIFRSPWNAASDRRLPNVARSTSIPL